VHTQTLGLPRVAWILAISAFLCGGMISAAVFSVGWRHEAQRGNSAESALAAATARSHALSGQLAVQLTRSAALAATRSELATANSTLHTELASARRALAHAKKVIAGVGTAAAPLSGDLDKITSELRSLTGYLASTAPGQLDAGYVQAQVAYLSKTVSVFRAEVAAVQAQAR
jgi:hypothetical protein